MTQIVLNGSDKTTQDQYTGPRGEVTFDFSNWNLRLHNGSTPGGHVFLNRDNADNRYQPRSAELDGIVGFEPQQRGILVRLGPSDYRLRTLEVNEDNLAITNANGYVGNPKVELAQTILSEHTWEGQHVFNDVVEFTAGINADVSGDTAGTHTGPVVGNVTGNLTGNAAGSHTGSFTGDVDVRGETLQLDDNQIPTSKIGGLIAFIKLHGFPAGAITMWSGSEGTIPAGWYLCNGLNGTPDLRNKFIVGAGTGGAYAVADSGGFVNNTPTATVANSASHTHAVTGTTASSPTGVTLGITFKAVDAGSSEGAMMRDASLTDPGHVHGFSTVSDAGGVHNHTATVSTIDNRPPYYALCYIMKG